jgi:hypothetical protein
MKCCTIIQSDSFLPGHYVWTYQYFHRIFASGLDGAIYMWDRRLSRTHCFELTASPESQFNSVKLNTDNRVCQLFFVVNMAVESPAVFVF